PSNKYGYMVPNPSNHNSAESSSYLTINHFVEKPDVQEATRLIALGAMWNSGIFAFKLNYLIELIKMRGYPTEYERLQEVYSTLPTRSFDFEVVEKELNIAAIAYEGSWV